MATKKKETKRSFRNRQEIDTDLFKLEVSTFRKNVSYNPQRPVYEGIEHCHFYRTYDSQGKPMKKSTATGGHWHDVKIKEDENGELFAEIGPAKNAQGFLKGDNHTHDSTYLYSDKVEPRKFVPEFNQIIQRAQ